MCDWCPPEIDFCISVGEDTYPALYNFLKTLPQPPPEIICELPCGFHYVVLSEDEYEGTTYKIARLYCKK